MTAIVAALGGATMSVPDNREDRNRVLHKPTELKPPHKMHARNAAKKINVTSWSRVPQNAGRTR